MSKQDKMLEELKRIRELLEPKPAPPPPKGLWNGFTDFLSKYKVMGLTVAFIPGLYLGALVQALVEDLIMPIISLALPDVAWKDIAIAPSCRPFHRCPNNIHNRSLCNLHISQGHETMGNRITQTFHLFFFRSRQKA